MHADARGFCNGSFPDVTPLRRAPWFSRCLGGTRITLLLCISLLLITAEAQAVVKVWVNNTNDNQWTTANNWSPVGVPAAADTVEIGTNMGAPNTAQINSGAHTIAGLLVGDPFFGGTLTINTGSLIVNGPTTVANGSLTQTGGTLTFNGVTTIDSPFSLSGGTQDGTGAVTIGSSTTMTWSGGALSGSG